MTNGFVHNKAGTLSPKLSRIFQFNSKVCTPSTIRLLGLICLNVALGIPLSVLGVVVNILNLLVLSRHNLKETTSIMLLSLSSLDLFYSFTSIFVRLPSLIKHIDPYFALTLETFITLVIGMPNSVCFVITIFHVTAIGVERAIAVLFPFHVSRIFTPYRVKWMLLGLYLFGSVPVWPYYYRFTYRWVFVPTVSKTVAVVIPTDFYFNNKQVIDDYVNYFVNNTTTTVPIILIFICSSLIIFQLNRIKTHELSNKTSKQKKELKVVKMLLVICLVSFMVLVPEYVLHSYLAYYLGKLSWNFYCLVSFLVPVMYQVNACVNFFIYITMSSKFAETYKSLVRRGRKC
ncbi:melanin-concentrating hormone receptor 1-like [Physella acuta]|uniref:melanin-concentrating hormone receptor 1-like n=1 Tax=Physella acuta TaxID=109671 RepID=UPI0027DE8359|nr:melanin-concentrating hormone receptor 1-like [Physella acuta]